MMRDPLGVVPLATLLCLLIIPPFYPLLTEDACRASVNDDIVLKPDMDEGEGQYLYDSSEPEYHTTGDRMVLGGSPEEESTDPVRSTSYRGISLHGHYLYTGWGAGEVKSSGLADSQWPCFRGNARHTGLSPYNTSSNDGKLKWKKHMSGGGLSSPSIGPDGTIYVCGSRSVYAFYPNGTLRWIFYGYSFSGSGRSSPAIASDGTIYVGSHDGYLYALHPNGTLKWKALTGNYIDSSPAIASDGTIYVGSTDTYVYAFYPNGTLRWSYKTGSYVHSSPAIASDGTIYIGSFDGYLYALNPDGLLKWRAPLGVSTGKAVWGSPGIGPDGTVYVQCNDFYLYAIKPDGRLVWRKKQTPLPHHLQ